MTKNEIIKEIMHKVHKALVFESMAGRNTGDKMATFSELCGDMVAGIEKMLNSHIIDNEQLTDLIIEYGGECSHEAHPLHVGMGGGSNEVWDEIKKLINYDNKETA